VILVKAKGVTMFEMMLVLVIAGMIIALSISRYWLYERRNEMEQLTATVNTIFRALENYYQANCIQNRTYSGTITTNGALDPSNTTAFPSGPPVMPFSQLIDISTQLLSSTTAGYLTQPIIPLDLVDTTVGYQGFIVQFNLATVTRESSNSSNVPLPIGTVYFWKPQVAVKMRDATNIAAYKNALAANCVSDLDPSGKTVIPCESTDPTPPLTGAYLVWERLPMFADLNAIPNTWPSAPLLKQFKDQYTHDTFYEMNNAGKVETTDSSGSGPSYYLCGG
jgi:type II secretory pathway pseudopilin PulG